MSGSTPLVVAHGAGSSPAVAAAAFPGAAVRSFWLAGHGPAPVADDDGATDRASLDALVREVRPAIVAGISYGAHQVARWAAGGLPSYVRGIALVMPAWTGAPDATAAATAAQADAFEAVGVAAELARITAAWPGWVADALATAWPTHDPVCLVAALRAVGSSRGPEPGELARLTVPTAVVALPADPLHPEAVAREWARLLPQGRFAGVAAHSLQDLGRTALAALAD